MSNAKSKRNSGILIIILGAIIILLLALFVGRANMDSSPIEKMLQVPRIKVPIVSNSDGSVHTLSADFYVDIPDSAKADVSALKLQLSISEILKDINYDELVKKDSLDKVLDKIKDELVKLYPDTPIDKVYVKNFLTDFGLPETNTNSVDDRLKRFKVD